MPAPDLTRRAALAAVAGPWLPGLAGCATPLPIVPPSPVAGEGGGAPDRRLRDSAEAHGLAAYRGLVDINVGYDGQWRPLIDRIQPEVVDAGFRGSSQERLLPRAGVVAQAYRGARGRKQVCWRRGGAAPNAETATDRAAPAAQSAAVPRAQAAAGAERSTGRSAGDAAAAAGEVAVWFNGVPSSDAARLDAAALVAEGYGLFLLGPLWLVDRGLAVRLAGTERVDGRLCDVLQVWLSPGLGRVALDRVALCIDRADAVMRRVRFTLEGFAGTRGAVAEVDTFEHARRFGVLWPMRSYERVVHPLPLPAHDWRITGLDVNRGYAVADVAGAEFTGRAAAPAGG